MSLQALREKRAAKAKALNELVNKTDWNPEKDQPVYDAGMQEIDDIDAHIKRISDMNEKVAREAMTDIVIEASARAGKDQKSAGAAVYAKWLRGGGPAILADRQCAQQLVVHKHRIHQTARARFQPNWIRL